MGLGADTDISQQKFGSDLGIGSGRGVEEVKKNVVSLPTSLAGVRKTRIIKNRKI